MDTDVVLIVEDDATLLRGLNDNFRFKGYKVLTASDGRNGLDLALKEHPDVIVLDIMMPEMDGYEVCKRIRKSGLEIPIIMLTAKGREEDIIRGLNAGAHDYITKPFSIKELLARTSSLLKRNRRSLPEIFSFGECSVNMVSHKLFRNGEEVALTPKEFGLLIYFIRHLGRALTRDDIMQEVWGSDILVTPRSVDRCINTLRQKVEPTGSRPVFIQTIRDIGYRFEVPADFCDGNAVENEGKGEAMNSLVEQLWAEDVVIGPFCLKTQITPNHWIAERANEPFSILQLPWLFGQDKAKEALRNHCSTLHELSSPILTLDQGMIELNGIPCFVEKHDKGETLAERLQRGSLEPSAALELLMTLTRSLKKAHKLGLYHGNISPKAVILGTDGPRLLQYGVATARFLVSGHQLGQWDDLDIGVQSPQRLLGEPLTATDDVFALGALYYWALAGKGPFDASQPILIGSQILKDEPISLMEHGFDRKIWRIIAHALEKDADDRFQSLNDLEFALSDLL